MNTRSDTIAALLASALGEGHEDLVAPIEALLDARPAYKQDKAERELLRGEVRTLMRPRTNNLRALIDCPDRILDALAARAAVRADLLELLPAGAQSEQPATPA